MEGILIRKEGRVAPNLALRVARVRSAPILAGDAAHAAQLQIELTRAASDAAGGKGRRLFR
eukprot:4986169-Prymnesium_polylepis.1